MSTYRERREQFIANQVYLSAALALNTAKVSPEQAEVISACLARGTPLRFSASVFMDVFRRGEAAYQEYRTKDQQALKALLERLDRRRK